MQFILSRKGFDGQFGGSPSPIFICENENDKNHNLMFSLPIPESSNKTNFELIGTPYDQIDFRGFKPNFRFFHLDPDIRENIYKKDFRPENWNPILGQTGIAAKHLLKTNSHDIMFLFFGLFCFAKINGSNHIQQWKFTGKPFHAIWGYMKTTETHVFGKDNEKDKEIFQKYSWHAHVKEEILNRQKRENQILNVLFIGNKETHIDDYEKRKYKSFGVFRFDKKLVLTKEEGNSYNKCLTRWDCKKLPWINEIKQQANMTHHSEKNFKGEFNAARIGQEFILNDYANNVAESWLKKELLPLAIDSAI